MRSCSPRITNTAARRALAGALGILCILTITSVSAKARSRESLTPPPKPAAAAVAERLKVVPSPSRPGTVIMIWSGKVEPGMADAINTAFHTHKASTRRIVLSLNSGGGSVDEGRRVIAVLGAIKRTHELDTFVKAGSMCGSMCVPIYLQGQKRYAATSSLWLFHEVSYKDNVTKQITRLDRPAFQKLIDDFFIPAGVSKDWIATMLPNTQGTDYWRTGDALIRENSNIVHQATSDTNKRIVVGSH